MKKLNLRSTLFNLGAIILNHYALLVLYWMLTNHEPIQGTELQMGNIHLTLSRWVDPLFFGPFVMLIYVFMGDDIKRIFGNFLQKDFYEDCSKGTYEKNVTKICTIGVATGIAIGFTSSLGTDLVIAGSIMFSAWFGAMLIAPIIKDLYSSLWVLHKETIMVVVVKTSVFLGITIGATVAIIASITSAGSATGILLGLVSGAFATTSSIIVGTMVAFITPVLIKMEHDTYVAWMKKLDESAKNY